MKESDRGVTKKNPARPEPGELTGKRESKDFRREGRAREKRVRGESGDIVVQKRA